MLAVGGLGGGNATDDMVGANIGASNAWAFYQAKNVRQTSYQLAVDEIDVAMLSPALTEAQRATLREQQADYRATIARYDDEPDAEAPGDGLRGDGKKQIRARAENFETAFERASARDNNFDLAEVALQLALVLGSVAILTLSRWLLMGAAGLGVVGAVLTLNGFLLLFALPG